MSARIGEAGSRVRVITLPGVFKPRVDSWLLADLLAERVRPGCTVLDLCTGSGVLALAAARAGAGQVAAVDVSRRAVWTVRANAALNRVRVRAYRGDLFAAPPPGQYDLIVSNPPYLPARGQDLPRRGRRRAWDAGHDGRALLDRICAQAAARLTPGGSLLLVQSSLCGEQATLDRLAAAGLSASVVSRRRGPLGPLLSARIELLRERGLLAADCEEEELLFVEATRPVGAGAAGAAAASAAGAAGAGGATIVPYRDGPYVVSGSFVVRDQDGNQIEVQRRTIALCRCGKSKLRPFCDGTHKTVGFRASSAPPSTPGSRVPRG